MSTDIPQTSNLENVRSIPSQKDFVELFLHAYDNPPVGRTTNDINFPIPYKNLKIVHLGLMKGDMECVIQMRYGEFIITHLQAHPTWEEKLVFDKTDKSKNKIIIGNNAAGSFAKGRYREFRKNDTIDATNLDTQAFYAKMQELLGVTTEAKKNIEYRSELTESLLAEF